MPPAKRRGLGRGLDALLSTGNAEAPTEAGSPQEAANLDELPVERIRRGKYQPRSSIREEGLQELADSIRAQGVVQPVVVRPVGENAQGQVEYELIAGERRWRASQLAGLEAIPAVIRDVPDEAAVAMALIENIQREDLNPLEEAAALKRLQDEFGLTHQQTAEAVGKSRAGVTNLLRLLDLNNDVKAELEENYLTMGHAKALLGLTGSAQSQAARKVIEQDMSVRETEALVRRLQNPPPETPAPVEDPNIRRLQRDVSEKLGAEVAIKHAQTGKGKLTISYNSLDELDGILARIQ